jgi:hypothetical protein
MSALFWYLPTILRRIKFLRQPNLGSGPNGKGMALGCQDLVHH